MTWLEEGIYNCKVICINQCITTPLPNHCYACVRVLCFVFLLHHADTTAIPTPVDLEVTDVTSTSAVLHWRLDGDSRVGLEVNFIGNSVG